MRFFLDEDISHQVAVVARSLGCDVVSSQECSRNGWDDRTQLRVAAEEGRCVVTRNAKDFVPLTTEFARLDLPHAGVLLVPNSLPGRSLAAMAAALLRCAELHPSGLPAYMVDFLR